MSRAEEISRQLAAGHTFTEIAVEAMPESARGALCRCVLAAGFDADAYQDVLRGETGPDLTDLANDGVIEPRPGIDGDFRVSRALQSALWSRWWTDAGMTPGSDQVPRQLARFGRSFAEYCQAHDRPLEALRGLVVSDQGQAAALLVEQYRVADESFDLARCRDLLATLDEERIAPLVGPDLHAVRKERTAYFAARAMWRRALLGSLRYLSRPAVEQHLVGLLDGDPHRALRLAAGGGMGKSTTLQWFIARYCVPREPRIACALIDMDAINAVNASRYPWVVLLEIAAQLNPQLVGGPFTELLADHGSYRSVLVEQADEASRAGAAALAGRNIDKVAEDAAGRFADALSENPDAVPVLVVVDTIEEVMLRPAGNPRALVETLADVLDAVPQVRLVFSGRRTRAEDGIAGLWRRLPPEVLDYVEIELFEPEEARRYLTDKRGLPRADVVEALILRAGGQPWMLALCADYVQYQPDIEPSAVAQLDPALAWCLDRVVGRVSSNALRWLVRYAIVLRRLRRDVAHRVLFPHVVAAMRGRSTVDRPSEDVGPGTSRAVFRTGGELPTFDELWDDLLSYVATSSWVKIEGDRVTLHASVVEPLRKLVSAQGVHWLLHADAAAYYDGLADQDDSPLSEWRREAIYHHFQHDGAAAGAYWRTVLDGAHAASDVDAVLDIAGEVLGPEYVDEDGQAQRTASGTPVIDAEIRVRANLDRAWGLSVKARRAQLSGAHQDWSGVEVALAEVDRLAAVPPPLLTRWLAARAALLTARGQHEQAVDVLLPIGELNEATADSCYALMVSADALTALARFVEAESALLRAKSIAEQRGDRTTTAHIAQSLATRTAARGSYGEALRWASAAAQAADAAGDETGPSRASVVEFTRLSGAPALAARLAEGPLHGEVATQHARALLDAGRPTAAAAVCAAALIRAPELGWADIARLRTVAGIAAAELLDLDPALGYLLQTREEYLNRKDLENAAFCSAEAARIHLRHVGNLTQAEQYVDEGLRLTPATGSPGWTSLRLALAELYQFGDDTGRAVTECTQVLDALRTGRASPARLVSAALHALAFGDARHEAFRRVVVDSLATIFPAGARLAAVADLELVPYAAELRLPVDLFEGSIDGATELDLAWRSVRIAEVLRTAGRREEAVASLNRGTMMLADTEQSAWWSWLQAMERIGPAAAAEPEPPALTDVPALLGAAYHASLAMRRFMIDPLAVTQMRVQSARDLLTRMTRITRWHAVIEETSMLLASEMGDRAEQQRSQNAARAWYRQLGNDRAAAAPGEEHQLTGGHELSVHVELRSEGLGVAIAGHPPTVVTGAGLSDALWLQTDYQASPSELVHNVVEAIRATGGLDALPIIELPEPPAEPVDVRITLEPPLLAQVPWELWRTDLDTLAADPRVRVVYRVPKVAKARSVQTMALQRALVRAGFDPKGVDGLLGPLTQRCVRAFQEVIGLVADGVAGSATWRALVGRVSSRERGRQPQVLVLRREAEAALRTQRESRAGGYDLESLYHRYEWSVEVFEGSLLDSPDLALDRARKLDQVDIVHISATMDVTQTVPQLSFGSSPDAKTWSRSLPVTALDRFVLQLSARGVVPLVVLDIAAPPRDSELVRQLLARNDFAHQLVALGRVETVLATGLAGVGYPTPLVKHLVSGATAAEVAGRMQAEDSQGWLAGLLPFAGTALVTSVLPETMVPLPQY